MAKTKALISFAVTAKLICVFVFAYAKSWFSHDAAHMACVIWKELASEEKSFENFDRRRTQDACIYYEG